MATLAMGQPWHLSQCVDYGKPPCRPQDRVGRAKGKIQQASCKGEA